jgi:hypothetical protein
MFHGLCGIKREGRAELGQGSELARSPLLFRQLKVNRRIWRDGGGTRQCVRNNGITLKNSYNNQRSKSTGYRLHSKLTGQLSLNYNHTLRKFKRCM